MASKRTKRPTRFLLLLVGLALVLMLLELNRFLPGLMPGGGGDGGWRRDAPDPTVLDLPPADALERETGTAALEAAGLRPPPIERRATVIEVRTPDGTWMEDFRIRLGGATAASESDAATGTFRSPRAQAEGGIVRVDAKGGSVFVEPRLGMLPEGPWAFVIPDAPPRRPRGQGRVELRYERDASEASTPIRLKYSTGREVEASLQGREGTIALDDSEGPVQIRIGEGANAIEHWVHPRSAPLATWRIPQRRRVPWSGAHGEVLDVRTRGGALRTARVDTTRGELEIEAGGDETLVVRARLRGREYLVPVPTGSGAAPSPALPASRQIRIRVLDAEGNPTSGGVVQAAWEDQGGTAGLTEPITLRAEGVLDGNGLHVLTVPEGAAVRVVGGAEGKAAAEVVVGSDTARADLTLGVGRTLTVTVRGINGKPMADAAVYVVTSTASTSILHEARTDAQGRAQVAGIGGSAEVFAHAPGHAWSRAVLDAATATATLELQAGYPLRLRVADALGVPMAGVRVDVSPEDTKTPLVLPPREGALRIGATGTAPWDGASPATRDRTDAHGALVVPGLPIGAYTVRLHRSDLAPLTAYKLTPGPRTWFITATRR